MKYPCFDRSTHYNKACPNKQCNQCMIIQDLHPSKRRCHSLLNLNFHSIHPRIFHCSRKASSALYFCSVLCFCINDKSKACLLIHFIHKRTVQRFLISQRIQWLIPNTWIAIFDTSLLSAQLWTKILAEVVKVDRD